MVVNIAAGTTRFDPSTRLREDKRKMEKERGETIARVRLRDKNDPISDMDDDSDIDKQHSCQVGARARACVYAWQSKGAKGGGESIVSVCALLPLLKILVG